MAFSKLVSLFKEDTPPYHRFLVLAALAAFPMLLSSIFMVYYYNLHDSANIVNEANHRPGIANTFDSCGLVTEKPSGEFQFDDTKWSVVYTLNTVIYAMLSLWTVIIALSAYCVPLVCLGSCGFTLTQLAHFGVLIVTGIFRFNKAGDRCAQGHFPIYELHERTTAEIGHEMKYLFIAQCILFIPYSCCMGMLLQTSVTFACLRFNKVIFSKIQKCKERCRERYSGISSETETV